MLYDFYISTVIMKVDATIANINTSLAHINIIAVFNQSHCRNSACRLVVVMYMKIQYIDTLMSTELHVSYCDTKITTFSMC